jgi:DNA helicase-2/ATP-dependent DNA helicase PcrA
LERTGASAGLSSDVSDASHSGPKVDAAGGLPRVSPDVFKQGMTVTHPEYGPGKIIALSGMGKNRRATIQFATVGQKKIILAHSSVRPAR